MNVSEDPAPDDYFRDFCTTVHLEDNRPLRIFLLHLYQLDGQETKRQELLEGASVPELNIAIKAIHHMLHQGSSNIDYVVLSYLLDHFGSKKSVKSLVNGRKFNKIKALLPITCFHQILRLMFEREISE